MKKLTNQENTYLQLFEKELTQEQVYNIQMWIEALESGKYKQGKGMLQPTPDTYCCLGVANEVCKLGSNPNMCNLHSVLELGLWDNYGTCNVTEILSVTLTKLNDTVGWSFKEIANLLRDQLQFSKVVLKDGEFFVVYTSPKWDILWWKTEREPYMYVKATEDLWSCYPYLEDGLLKGALTQELPCDIATLCKQFLSGETVDGVCLAMFVEDSKVPA